jgi:hypothetical protein
MATEKQIREKHHTYYEILMEQNDTPSVESATVAAAILTLAHVVSQSGKNLDA